MEMESIHTFKQQNPHIHLNVIPVASKTPVFGMEYSKYVLSFSHMSVNEGFNSFPHRMTHILADGMLMAALSIAAGHLGGEMGTGRIPQWSKEHKFNAAAYEYDGNCVVCISADNLRSRPMLLPQDFPSTCLDSTRPCQHCCCSWIRALSTLAKIWSTVSVVELQGTFPKSSLEVIAWK
jgi:hypothetical protein